VVFRTIGILLRFLCFFENPKSRDFLRFFAVFRTFSRTMIIGISLYVWHNCNASVWNNVDVLYQIGLTVGWATIFIYKLTNSLTQSG